MQTFTVAFLGDIVGGPGREAAAAAAKALRQQHGARFIIANAENAKHGSGLSPDNYRELRRAGIDAITLGDHCFRERTIRPILDDPGEPVCRPANLSPNAPGKRLVQLDTGGTRGSLYVLTLLGRVFMPIPADSPFDILDRELAALPDPDAMVIVEIHAEVTSEKAALAWHAAWQHGASPAAGEVAARGEVAKAASRPRVVAVLGSHTHVQTADARLIERQVAFISDLGMTGPHRSIIGRSIAATLESMARQFPAPLDVASDEPAAQGVLLTLDPVHRRALAIASFTLPLRDRV